MDSLILWKIYLSLCWPLCIVNSVLCMSIDLDGKGRDASSRIWRFPIVVHLTASRQSYATVSKEFFNKSFLAWNSIHSGLAFNRQHTTNTDTHTHIYLYIGVVAVCLTNGSIRLRDAANRAKVNKIGPGDWTRGRSFNGATHPPFHDAESSI